MHFFQNKSMYALENIFMQPKPKLIRSYSYCIAFSGSKCMRIFSETEHFYLPILDQSSLNIFIHMYVISMKSLDFSLSKKS